MTVFLQQGRRAPLKTTAPASAAAADAALTSVGRASVARLATPASRDNIARGANVGAEATDENRHCTANVATRLYLFQVVSLRLSKKN